MSLGLLLSFLIDYIQIRFAAKRIQRDGATATNTSLVKMGMQKET